MMEKREVLIHVENLNTHFPIKKGLFKKTVGYVKAVNNVSLDIYKGEILGVVGESGCGKTTFGKSILRLIKSSSGNIMYNLDGKDIDINSLNKKEMDKMCMKMQIIFQDPYASFNPAFTIFGSMEEPLIKMGMKNKKERKERVSELLKSVNLMEEYMTRYPNEFSGGQRQRISIARALSVEPEFVVCDEAVSALDVSIQAQIIKLLKKLQQEKNLTYMFITHDLSVVEYISDRIIVMYLGNIVEIANTGELFKNTLHPYTKTLLSAIPIADINKKKKRIPLQGDVPSPANPPSGCTFHPRCPDCMEVCKKEIPKIKKIITDDGEHVVFCHLIEERI